MSERIDIHGPHRMNPDGFSSIATKTDGFHIFSEISEHLRIGTNIQQIDISQKLWWALDFSSSATLRLAFVVLCKMSQQLLACFVL